MRHPNLDLCNALIRLPDGTFSTSDLENQEKIPWRPYTPCNARPERVKFCPWCWQDLPIVEFLEGGPARSILRLMTNGDELALFVENVREWCVECQRRAEEKYLHEN